MALRKLKTLIDLVSESGISELEVNEGEDRVRIVNAGSPAQAGHVVYANPAPTPAMQAAPAAAPTAAAAPAPEATQAEGTQLGVQDDQEVKTSTFRNYTSPMDDEDDNLTEFFAHKATHKHPHKVRRFKVVVK